AWQYPEPWAPHATLDPAPSGSGPRMFARLDFSARPGRWLMTAFSRRVSPVWRPEFMATQRERIGFIGLGSMGRPMATSLIRKGFALTAFDTAVAHTDVLVERGAARAADLAAPVA